MVYIPLSENGRYWNSCNGDRKINDLKFHHASGMHACMYLCLNLLAHQTIN